MSGAASLQEFREWPARYADPGIIAPQLAPALRAETAGFLLRSPRTASRANALLSANLPDGRPIDLDRDDARLILTGPQVLDRVGLACGAVWHGKRVRALLRGPDIAALDTACGPAARQCAQRHAPPAIEPEITADLLADIRRDAAKCVAAWLAALPDWAAARMRLVRKPEPAPDHPSERLALMRAVSRDVLP